MSSTGDLVYGLRDGKLIHIKSAANGAACGCVCPECGDRLIAKQGSIRAWHFAHESNLACVTAPETALHKMVKQKLLEAEGISLPPLLHLFKCELVVFVNGETVEPALIDDERSFGTVTPDIYVKTVDGREFFIEIYVTHAVDDEKIEKLEKIGIPTLELDFSETPRDISPEQLDAAITKAFYLGNWVYHPAKSCPVCSKTMVLQYGKHGWFYKCPRCQYVGNFNLD